ncbi:hypothetical protein vBValMR11Z_372 [Vibrio phage vB_ValM_R11Z]|nr:hypothetical protein vBValMR11Z_372 [Vibrio phage vB_ValM_R11Z]
MIINILAFYLLVALGAYLYIAGGDYAMYKLKGKLDNKFPITSIETHKCIAFFSLIWFALVLFFIRDRMLDMVNYFTGNKK